jgi:hypothetical protein
MGWAVVLLAVALLVGCKPSTSGVGLGEGTGEITRDDFSPFPRQAPVDLLYFTAPRDARFRVTLATAGGRDGLRNPRIFVMRGRVRKNQDDFLREFDRGRGVIARGEGLNIADTGFPATDGDIFTLVFTSSTNDLGHYNYEISRGGGSWPGP